MAGDDENSISGIGITKIKEWDSTLNSGIAKPSSMIPSPVSGVLNTC